MNRPSTRLVVAGMAACLIGGTALSASADSASDSSSKKDHTVCLINQDGPTGPQHGICVTLPLH